MSTILFDPTTFKQILIDQGVEEQEAEEAIKNYMGLTRKIHKLLFKRDVLMCQVMMKTQMTWNDLIKKQGR